MNHREIRNQLKILKGKKVKIFDISRGKRIEGILKFNSDTKRTENQFCPQGYYVRDKYKNEFKINRKNIDDIEGNYIQIKSSTNDFF